MAAEKTVYELKANFNSAEVAVGERLVRLEEGKQHATNDPAEIRALEDHPAVKHAEKPTTARKADS